MLLLPIHILPLLLLPFTQSTFATTTNPACTALLTLLPPDTILTPNTPGSEYTNATLNAWNAFNRPPFYTPGCIVLPTTASHVQIAMRTIFQFGVAYNVQSGGHSAMKGWNTVDEDGVLVLFTNMRKVVYDEEKGSITLEPGVTWGEAVGQMAQFGVTPVGGRISDVGTALLLGGGLSFLSPRHGFASDTYISLDVVLVDGTLVTATQDNEYKDLFWALKGGGSRFGIVVKYELKAVQTHDNDGDETWYGGVLTFDPSNETIHTFLRAVVAFTRENTDPDAVIMPYIAEIVFPSSSPDTPTILTLPTLNLFYNSFPRHLTPSQTEETFNTTFSAFLSLPLSPIVPSSLKRLSYNDIMHLNDETPEMQGRGQVFGGSAFSAGDEGDEETYIEAYEYAHAFAEKHAEVLNSTVLAFTPVRDAQIAVGGNPMVSASYAGEGGAEGLGPYNAVQWQVTFASPNTDASEKGEVEGDRQTFFERFPPSEGTPLYLNECDKTQEVFETYVGYEVLKGVRERYDVSGFSLRYMQGPEGL